MMMAIMMMITMAIMQVMIDCSTAADDRLSEDDEDE